MLLRTAPEVCEIVYENLYGNLPRQAKSKAPHRLQHCQCGQPGRFCTQHARP